MDWIADENPLDQIDLHWKGNWVFRLYDAVEASRFVFEQLEYIPDQYSNDSRLLTK